MITQETNQPRESRKFTAAGYVRFADATPAVRTEVAAFDRDLRREQRLGDKQKPYLTDRNGAYCIEYTEKQFLNQERGAADLVVKAMDSDGSVLVSSPVLFNAPAKVEIDLTIPLERKTPPPLFERIEAAVAPLLGKIKVEELEEDEKNQDLTFLAVRDRGSTSEISRDSHYRFTYHTKP